MLKKKHYQIFHAVEFLVEFLSNLGLALLQLS